MFVQIYSKFVAVLVVAVLVSANQDLNTSELIQLTGYNCTGSGFFAHPDKCTAFVVCDSHLKAFEVTCEDCGEGEVTKCPEGKLHYNVNTQQCELPEIAGCGPRPTTTRDPSECDLLCMQVGDCDCFDSCVADNSSSTGGRWTYGVRCDPGHYWNPDFNSVHGGSCDFWDNLSDEVKDKYRNDDECPTPAIPCRWEAIPKCDNKYLYLPEGSKNDREIQTMYCPLSPSGQHLFWNQAELRCGSVCASFPKKCKVCS